MSSQLRPIALLPRGRDTISKAKHWDSTWEKLLETFKLPATALGRRDEAHNERKTYAEQFIPALFVDNPQSKSESEVVSVSYYVLDVDKCKPSEHWALLEHIRSLGLAFFSYVTYSHVVNAAKAADTEDPSNYPHSFRVIFPLSRPVLLKEWKIFWANARLEFHRLADPTCAYAAKGYLAPCYPEELGDDERFDEWFVCDEGDGKPIDVNAMIRKYQPSEAITDGDLKAEHPIDGSEILDFCKKLRSSRNPEKKNVGVALTNALGTETPYAQAGERDKMLLAMSGKLAHQFPSARLDQLTSPFRPGIEALAAKGAPDFEEFKKKVKKDQLKELRKAAEKEYESQQKRAVNASSEITKEDMQTFLARACASTREEDFRNRLVVQYKDTYFTFNGSGYDICNPREFMPRCLSLNRKASSLGFSAFYASDGEGAPKVKTVYDIVDDNGVVATSLEYHLKPFSYFEETSRTMLVSMAANAPIEAECVPEVDRWIEEFCANPSDVDRVQDWLSQVPNVDMPLCALVLIGEAGTGKSKLASGVAALWGARRPTDMAVALGQFNVEMARCPLLLADESFPKIDGKIPTDKIRSLITSDTHHINPKGLPHAMLRGYVRCMGAMNPDGFNLGSFQHSQADNDAIAKRFLIVRGKQGLIAAKAAELFFSGNYEKLIVQNGIAKHTLWLAQTRGRKDLRFGVDSGDSTEVSLRHDGCYSVLMWVVDWILSYKTKTATRTAKIPAAFIHRGNVYVNLKSMHNEWKEHSPDERRHKYLLRDMKDSLDVASKGIRERVRSAVDDAYFWRIDPELLRVYVEHSQVEAWERFELLLGMSYEIDFRTQTFILNDEDRKERTRCMQALEIDPDDPTKGKVLTFKKKGT